MEQLAHECNATTGTAREINNANQDRRYFYNASVLSRYPPFQRCLNAIATPEQKARWLAPLVRGEIRSVFSMTETVSDGAGSDPSLLNTIAQQDGNDFLISGKKYMITGVPDAAFNIVMARTLDHLGKDLGATMFFVDIDAPGFRIERMLDTIDLNSPGGHAEVSFDRVRVTPDRVLGEVGQGFRNAQVRLGPARLTHCMRWGPRGAARRSRSNTPGAGIRSAAPSASIRAWDLCLPTTTSTCICRAWRSGTRHGCWISTKRRVMRPA